MRTSMKSFSQVSALITIIVGCIVFTGWLFDVDTLKRLLPGSVAMKVNAALCFVALGSSLWLLQVATPSRLTKWTSTALAGGVIVVSLLTLSQDFSGINLGLDELLMLDNSPLSAISLPGRMSPIADLCFLFAGSSLLTARHARASGYAWGLALLVLLISFIVLIGYAYGTTSLYQVAGYSTIALPTAIVFLVLSLGLIMTHPTNSLRELIVSDTAGGYVARRLLPLFPLVIFCLGWLRLLGEQAGWYDSRFGLALMVLSSSIIAAAIVIWIAQKLRNVDQERLQHIESLRHSNLDLQRFASVASHDLQTPLRSVVGFAQLLQSEYQGKLDEQAEDWIRRIVQATKQMQALIEELLAYSRLNATPRSLQKVALQEVMDNVRLLLDALIQETQAQITCDRLPEVMGIHAQMVQLMQNLLSNALKFRGDQMPQIHISAKHHQQDWIISVQDNGIGIEAKYQDRIFEIFQRLHDDKTYPGSGIGLAVCRTIVLGHGGKIWVESEFGRGSIFRFTLPKMERAHS